MVLLTLVAALPDNQFKMLRILMVLEDYGELMFLQTVLKKIGFDVDAIQNPRSFTDHVLRMNPDLLIMTASGKRVNGLDLARSVKKLRGLPHILLLKAPGQPEEVEVCVDAWLPSPLGAILMLDTIAGLTSLDKLVLREKFQKLRLSEIAPDPERVLKIEDSDSASLEKGVNHGNFGVLKDSTLSHEDRQSRYAKFLNTEAVPEKHGFAVKQVQEQVKALRQVEQSEDLEALERERKAFVEHLFKKKPG